MRALTTPAIFVLMMAAACGGGSETSDASGVGGAAGGGAGAGGSGGGVAGAGGGAAGAGGGVAGAGGGVAGGGGGAAGAGGGVAGRGGSGGGGGGVAGRGGSGGAGGGNQACASAVLDGTCTTEGQLCGGESCTNACQFCNILRCTSSRWQRMESFPAPCFACGPAGLRCQTNAEYCSAFIGGVPGSQPSYACVMVPAACRPTPTCTCLQGQSIPGSCTQAGAGEILISLAAP
jgi:hypothetical protein